MADGKFAKKDDPAVAALIDEGHRLTEEYRDVLDRKDINREGLRALVSAGMASEAQAQTVQELYPPRIRGQRKTTTNAAEAA